MGWRIHLRGCGWALLLALTLAAGARADDSGARLLVFAADEIRDNVLLTSYWTVSESVCAAAKEPLYDRGGGLLGCFRADFLRDVRVEGWGRGDGDGNDGRYLGYYRARGFYLHDVPLDNRSGELVPWRTSASNSLPRGTRVRILALPDDLPRCPEIRQRLLTTVFVVSDCGSGLRGHQLDLYVGDQPQAAAHAAPESLYVPGACLALDYPE